MRILLTVGTLVGATLVPWSSLSLSWVGDRTGSLIEAGVPQKTKAPAARLSASLGILPVSADTPDTVASVSSKTRAEEPFRRVSIQGSDRRESRLDRKAVPAGVHCENGVCTLPTRSSAESPPLPTPMPSLGLDGSQRPTMDARPRPHSATVDWTWQAARERLRELGATQFRLETGPGRGEFRFSCSVPMGDQAGGTQQFTATASADMEAVAQVLDQIEARRRLDR